MQRIQTEAEIKAREEQQRLEQAKLKARQEQWRLEQAERERAQAEAMQSPAAIVTSTQPSPTAKAESKDMSQTLEQLRTLGELKDDGYITEEEFQKIKQRILDSQL
ncbi:MAG: SHOCT domain-containing protein [Gammaproteobacteria bacterium]|nr:SHOCT domain-containing protein [Gammaproteobacteria bacterium]